MFVVTQCDTGAEVGDAEGVSLSAATRMPIPTHSLSHRVTEKGIPTYMKSIVWKPIEGMEASGPWCDGTAVIDGKEYRCDVVTISKFHKSELDSVGHALFPCFTLGPWYCRGRGDYYSLLIVVADGWEAQFIPGYLDLLRSHIYRDTETRRLV